MKEEIEFRKFIYELIDIYINDINEDMYPPKYSGIELAEFIRLRSIKNNEIPQTRR